MPKTKEKPPQVRVVFADEMKDRFDNVKKFYGLQKNADLVRLLVTQKFEELKKQGSIIEKPMKPHFKMLNHDDRGVKVWDNQWNNGKGFDAQIQFTPEGKAYCCLCDAFKCEHIRFALEQNDVQKIFKDNGWKQPDES
jgi:hypothetical protein